LSPDENDLISGPSWDILPEYSQEKFPNMSDDDSIPKIPKTLPRRGQRFGHCGKF
jgi:hypothetical protein